MNNDAATETSPKPAGKTLRRNLIEWAVTLVACGLILYFFAPPSWWQFGPLNPAARRPTSDFSLPAVDGKPWSFAGARGKVVIINYWATWCGPCRFETPGLVSVATEMAPRGVEFVGVSVDDDLQAIDPFVAEYKIPYRILRPGNDPNVDGDMVLPTTFLYDKKGNLAKRYHGIVLESTLRSDIETLLAE